jgi:hypothetical protein
MKSIAQSKLNHFRNLKKLTMDEKIVKLISMQQLVKEIKGKKRKIWFE